MTGSKSNLGRTVEPPLEVLPISVRSPSTQNAKLPPTTPKDEGRDCFGTEWDEDSLLINSELATGAVSSILWDSNFKRVDAMSVEEVLALSLQVRMPLFVRSFVVSNYPLILSRFCRWLPI